MNFHNRGLVLHRRDSHGQIIRGAIARRDSFLRFTRPQIAGCMSVLQVAAADGRLACCLTAIPTKNAKRRHIPGAANRNRVPANRRTTHGVRLLLFERYCNYRHTSGVDRQILSKLPLASKRHGLQSARLMRNVELMDYSAATSCKNSSAPMRPAHCRSFRSCSQACWHV